MDQKLNLLRYIWADVYDKNFPECPDLMAAYSHPRGQQPQPPFQLGNLNGGLRKTMIHATNGGNPIPFVLGGAGPQDFSVVLLVTEV